MKRSVHSDDDIAARIAVAQLGKKIAKMQIATNGRQITFYFYLSNIWPRHPKIFGHRLEPLWGIQRKVRIGKFLEGKLYAANGG